MEWSDEFIQSDILPDKTKWGYDVGDGDQQNTDGTNAHTGGGEMEKLNGTQQIMKIMHMFLMEL